VAQALALAGTGAGVADPADPAVADALAIGTGVGPAFGTAVGQDSLGTGSGGAGFPVGLAEGALTVAEALGVADGWPDALSLA
jgi:hypothetical protein